MAAPKGNDYGRNPDNTGRPKEYDRIQIGKEFVEWAKDNPEALTVPMFAVSKGMHSGIMRNWARECEEFRALFQEGKEQIGINRLRATQTDTLDASIFRAHIGNYDVDINEYVREEKTFDANLSKEVNQSVSDNTMKAYDAHREQLQEVRKLYESAANIVDNMSKTDKTSA